MKPNGYNVTRECLACGSPFQITSSRNHYCADCRTRTCPVCSRVFIQPVGDGRVTCSDACSARHRIAPVLACGRCGAAFPQRGGHPTRYCSQRCRYLAARKVEGVLAVAERRGWRYKQWRRDVLARDRNRCHLCGSTTFPQAHHVAPWRDHPERRYDVANGQTLCADCHETTHGARVPRHPRRFPLQCPDCGQATKGRGPTCKSCAMKRALAVRKARLQSEAL